MVNLGKMEQGAWEFWTLYRASSEHQCSGTVVGVRHIGTIVGIVYSLVLDDGILSYLGWIPWNVVLHADSAWFLSASNDIQNLLRC